ncbi:MAG: Gfo/Idh/MocA family oxidoreductase [Gemmataceae bacterium]
MSKMNRRNFLQLSAAAGAGYWLTASAVSAIRAGDKPNEKIRVAGIGVGGKGSGDISQAGHQGLCVALCDVDEDFLNAKAKEFTSAKKYFDYRKMLDEMDKEIDAVTVSTPDHHHAPASIRAMRMGKHVYCQKPLTHTVWEARQMRLIAKEKSLCTQMGNQGTASNGLRRAVEFIQADGIGKVEQAHIWTNRPIWPQAPGIVSRPKDETPVPTYLHWDEWLGPAPSRPYHHKGDPYKSHRGTYHDFNWRGWWDFGTGALGDMACHTANMAFMALKLASPLTAVAEAGDVNSETCPSFAHVTLEFPGRGEMPPVTWHWYEGRKDGKNVLPSPDLVKGQGKRENGYAIFFAGNQWHFFNPNEKDPKKRDKVVSSGSFLVGEKAVLFSPDDYGADSYIVTESGVEKLTGAPEKLPINNGDDGGMKKEWMQAIRDNKPSIALSNFDYSGVLTEAVLLGNVAIRAGAKLEWDAEKCRVANHEAANQYVKGTYRKGWEI